MRRLTVCVVLGGCFDFDKLRATDDLSMSLADLAVTDQAALADGADDLASADFASPDLATGDLASTPDLGPVCLPPPGLPAQVFNVDSGGAGGAFTTIGAAVAAAKATGQQAAIRIAAGTYDENIFIDGPISLYGGWAPGFSCRPPSPSPTTHIHAVHPAPDDLGSGGRVTTIRVAGPFGSAVVLDGLELLGLADTNLGGRVVYSTGADVTIRNCAIQSHSPATLAVPDTIAVRVDNATLTMSESSVLAGGWGTFAVYLCTASAIIDDSQIVERDVANDTGHPLYANSACPPAPSALLPLQVRRSFLLGDGLPPNEAVLVQSPWYDTLIEDSALVVNGAFGNAFGADAGPVQLTLRGATLHGAFPNGNGLFGNTNIIFDVRDSIIMGAAPIFLNSPTPNFNGFAAGGKNLYFGTLMKTSMPAVIKLNNGDALTVDEYHTMFPADAASEHVDPMLAADGYHLTAASTAAIDRAGSCWGLHDVDGEPRQKGLACDVGADER